jgi:hypothetical protein
MELDELKQLWRESKLKLEASMRLNTHLLHQANLGKTDDSLKRLSRGLWFELAVNLAAVILLGSFAADHVHEFRFLIPAVALGVYVIALLIADLRQLVDINVVDYDEPVVTIQKRLELLRVRRIRATLWTLLFAPLMWLPLLIVALQGVFGVDVYVAVGPGWLAANALFGLAVIPLAILIARRYGKKLEPFPLTRALADAIAGRSLTAALAALDAIIRFEDDTPRV